MMNNEQIAILMSTYNGEKYLREQLESIINQSYKNITIFIRDDLSKDNTIKIIYDYKKKYPKNIFCIPGERNIGSAQSFIELLQYVYTNTEIEYFMFADQDDIWLTNKVYDSYKFIKVYNEKIPQLCHTDLKVVDEFLNEISPSFIKMRCLDPNKITLNRLLIQNNVTGCTMIFNRKLADYIVNHNFKNVAMHDWWISLVASVFGEIHYLEKATILYRQHSNNVVGATNVRSISFILNRLFNINHVKKTIHMSIDQAIEFRKIYENRLEKRNIFVLDEFISLKNGNKFFKWKTITRNTFLKQGFIQIVGEYLYI